jgi:hypothetical protein
VTGPTVQTYVTQGCSTSAVIGLSKQIAEEIGCMAPNTLVKFDPTANLQITSSAVLPYLLADAKSDLLKVASTRVVQVNSAVRTVPQQYLVFRWNALGRCGISAAAPPGRSNHESGRALDVANYSSLITAMANRGWAHDVPGDPVHFDHNASADIRGKDVLAFQRLWNRNNPNDKISEDAAYGPQTEARLKASPATGFTTGATCVPRVSGADVVAIDGPDKLAPGARGHYAITVVNNGTTDWPATTKIVVSGGGTSQLYDAASWTSPSEVGALGQVVAANGMFTLQLDVAAPAVSEETPIFTQLSLADGTAMMGQINLAVTVTPNGDDDTSGESGDANDDGIELTGGCSAGGSAGWLALAPVVLVLRRRRK